MPVRKTNESVTLTHALHLQEFKRICGACLHMEPSAVGGHRSGSCRSTQQQSQPWFSKMEYVLVVDVARLLVPLHGLCTAAQPRLDMIIVIKHFVVMCMCVLPGAPSVGRLLLRCCPSQVGRVVVIDIAVDVVDC